ncbi:unnamed protein product [Hymenolepis diminuta]|uniref:VOC domain-containing protein n=1 Tax=Hymenolepis diminuta TaxID=6216 RepID=A0A0R3SCR4_HYMDI|nr:unnamed protein product [Hymenolepis diminuta]
MAIRVLHYVFKINNRPKAVEFYKNILGMKVLRHEEFEEGCKAFCNGPYDGKWSKTMVGYGPEDNHFVLELTYNYGIGSYSHGNDFVGIHIHSPTAYKRVMSDPNVIKTEHDGMVAVVDPAGYQFFVHNEKSNTHDPVRQLEIFSDKYALLTFGEEQCQLKLTLADKPIDRGQAFGRVAYLAPLQKKMEEAKQTILTPLVSLDTPGKATVEVVILADPDGHEICFVGDEAFRSLSQVDPKGDELLGDAMAKDNSDEWFEKHGGKKAH